MATTALQLDEITDCLPRTVAPRKRQICVLLIEDSEDAMLLVRYSLQEYGGGKFHLEWAKCLSDGLSKVLNGGIDLVILDLGLPEASGALSYAWVREAVPEMPIVVLTGDAREETELSIFSNGVEDYLVKERVSGSLLVTTIQDVLSKDKTRRLERKNSHSRAQLYNWSSAKHHDSRD